MSMSNKKECSFFEFGLSKRPAAQSDILIGKFEKICTIPNLEYSRQIEFLIENVTYNVLDLRKI